MSSIAQRAVSLRSDQTQVIWWPVLLCLAIVISAATYAGLAPISCSIVTVCLFAGPHNWTEVRYLLTRMPGRWGALRGYFLTGIIGTVTLSLGFVALPYLIGQSGDYADWLTGVAVWNTLLIAWIATMIWLRGQQNPRWQVDWVIPVGLLLIGLNWLRPLYWSQLLVYVHPLVALVFLDRELAQHRSRWQRAFRVSCLCIPACIAVFYIMLGNAHDLPNDDPLSMAIANHAGASIISGVSTRFLVATHVFLELLHYTVWIVVLPLLTYRSMPWQLDHVPLAKRSAACDAVCYCLSSLA